MNTRMLGYLLGIILLIEAALMAFPTAVAAIYGEAVWPFLVTMAALIVIAAPFVIFKPKDTGIYAREGFVCVGAALLCLSLSIEMYREAQAEKQKKSAGDSNNG